MISKLRPPSPDTGLSDRERRELTDRARRILQRIAALEAETEIERQVREHHDR